MGASSADTVTGKGQKRARIMDIAEADITPITFSRIINFAQFERLLARDRACRNWIDDKIVALPAVLGNGVRSSTGETIRSGLRRMLN
jgi:hypothetical protein